jgi:putative ABC transport system permease protein
VKTLNLKRRRDIERQKWQFIAVLVTVILGVALFAGSFNAYLNLGSSLEGSYQRLAMADMTVAGADAGFVDTAAAIAGVATAIDRRQADVPFEVGEYTFLGRVVGMPPDGQPEVNMIDIDEGTYLDPDDADGVVVETHAAMDFELVVGDSFEIAGREVHVVGIATSTEYLWPARDSQNVFTPLKSFGVAFVDEAVLEGFESPATTDQVLVLYDEDAVVDEVDNAVSAAADAANAADAQPLADQPSNSTIRLEIGGLQTMAIALPVLFLVAAGMAIYVVITRLVFSQRGVIGTLRATGFTSGIMSRHYRSYGLGVGLVGAVIGAVLGGLMGRGMTAIYTAVFGIPDLIAEFHLPTVLMALAFGAVAGVLAAVPPARTVARMPPAEAMRGDAPAAGGKRSIFETLIPPLRVAPVRWRMTLRGIGRNKRRSGSMVVGVILALTLILASWGTLDTMLLAIDRQFNEIFLEDASVIHSVPVGDDQVADIEAVNGVAHGEPVIGLKATVSEPGGASYATLLEGYQQGTLVHGFPDGQPEAGVLLGQAMENLLMVGVGDRVFIEFPALETTIDTVVEGFIDEPLGTVAYMDADALTAAIETGDGSIDSEVLSLPAITTVKAQFDDGTDPAVVIERIKEVDGVAAAVDSTQLRELIEQYQLFFYVFVGIMLVFGGAMAFALIFNIISVNVAERVNEFASMRANGLTHRKVASMITGETFLLTAIGIVPGLFIGYLAAVGFMNSFSSDQFPISATVRPVSFIAAALAMFVVAGLSLIPAIRAIKRINVGEIVRERAV